MKRIKIIHYTSPDFTSIIVKQQSYHVFLWNSKTFYFQNKKDCLKFLAESNEFLNLKLFELNLILNNCYQQYRNSWFYLSASDCRKINNMFTGVDEMLELVHQRSHYINGNSYAGTYLINSIRNLETILKIVMIQNRKNLLYANINYCTAINSSLENMLNQINNYTGLCMINLQ